MTKLPTIKIHDRNGEFIADISAVRGAKLRDCMLAEGRSPYRERNRRLNCKGLGICGTCVVDVMEAGQWWERRSCQIQCFKDLEIKLK